MPVFQYRAVSHTGAMSYGVIEASDENGAFQALRAQRLRVLSLTRLIRPITSSRRLNNVELLPAAQLDSDAVQAALEKLGQRDKPAKGGKAPSEVDVMRLSAELGVLLTAGLPLDKAMRVQIDSAPEGEWRTTLSGCLDALKSGQSFSASLEASPDLFRPFFVNMVRSGEASGNLARVLTELGEYLERKRALRASVVSALTYPHLVRGGGFVRNHHVGVRCAGVRGAVRGYGRITAVSDKGDRRARGSDRIVGLDTAGANRFSCLVSSALVKATARCDLAGPSGTYTATDRACRGQVRGCPLFPLAGNVIAQRGRHA